MSPSWLQSIVLAGAFLIGSAVLPLAAPRASAVDGLHATLDGAAVPLQSVAQFTCHDRDYPLIRCFRDAAARDADLAAAAPGGTTSSPDLPSAFVRWYRDADYGGPSFEAYNSYPDLSVIGWNKQISSFTTLNGGHPVWWQDTNYAGTG
ncbi:MAG: hypothetical protein ACP5VP_09510 [Candidatus Limnocylindrales bacterium]